MTIHPFPHIYNPAHCPLIPYNPRLKRSRINLQIEKVKSDIMEEIQFETRKACREKEFEDAEVKDLYVQTVEQHEKRAIAIEKEVSHLLRTNREKIVESNRKFEKRKREHLHTYEREFEFKSKSETELVHKTLTKAVPFLMARDKALVEKMEHIKVERSGSLKGLKEQIKKLEEQVKRLQHQVAGIV